MTTMLDIALSYHRAGFSVFPLMTRSKVPVVDWKQYSYTRASEDDARGWWQSNPNWNIAICTGTVSGVFVVDCDTMQAGGDYWSRLEKKTYTVRTGSGMHFYHALPDFEVRNRVKLWENVDIRGEGGYVVAAGSVHPSGAQYRVINRARMTPAPDFVLDLLRPKPQPVITARRTLPTKGGAAGVFDKQIQRLLSASVGERNNALFISAIIGGRFVADGALTESEVEAALRGAANVIGLGETETDRTIRSGMTRGLSDPHRR